MKTFLFILKHILTYPFKEKAKFVESDVHKTYYGKTHTFDDDLSSGTVDFSGVWAIKLFFMSPLNLMFRETMLKSFMVNSEVAFKAAQFELPIIKRLFDQKFYGKWLD